MGFINYQVPQITGYTTEQKSYKAMKASDIAVRYRDTSGAQSSSTTVTASSIKYDLTPDFNEQILSGSVRLALGNDTFIDRNGLLYRNVDPNTGSGTASGTIQYGNGVAELTSWTPGTPNAVAVQGLTTTTDLPPINHVSFRVPTAPLRPGSLTMVVSPLAGGQLTINAGQDGVIETAQAHGFINYDTGFADIYFFTKTKFTSENRAAIEAQPWYDVSLEYTEGGSNYINVPVWIAPDTMRYNAIAYTYIPLDSNILGLSATRLPADGRVPIFRKGGIGVISASKTQALPDHIAGKTYQLNDVRLAWAELVDSNGAKVPFDMYVVDYDYGKVTLSGDFALNSLVAPLSAKYRYQDMGLISDVQINGQITFTKPVTHNYDAADSIVGSALVIGDMQARYTGKFEQETWINVWEDEQTGGAVSVSYNDALYPIVVTNKGAIEERWALVFTSNTDFKIIGESSGQIGTGSINADCTPINPVTGVPYFKVRKEGWGSGWVPGNVMRFNTKPALFPVWAIRTVRPSEPTVMSDRFQIQIRGDIDRVA